MGLPVTDPMTQLSLPPGFRFYPTDEELLVQYLCRKVAGYDFSLQIIADIDLYKFDPWVLPSKYSFTGFANNNLKYIYFHILFLCCN